jgi:hypothetical protein
LRVRDVQIVAVSSGRFQSNQRLSKEVATVSRCFACRSLRSTVGANRDLQA